MRETEQGAPPGSDVPEPARLERVAIDAAGAAADVVRSRLGRRALRTKSSPTDIVTQTDLDSEHLIRELLAAATPAAGFLGEEGGAADGDRRLQWVIDPLDGTVNFWYGLPVVAVSIAAAWDGVVVAGAVADVASGETFSAQRDGGARVDGATIGVSDCATLDQALVTTGFSYQPATRAAQGRVVAGLLPVVRDIRCFGSAALQLCWVGAGRVDGYFERDTKVWDYAAGTLVAAEGGAAVEQPCPENSGLVTAATPAVFDRLRELVDADDGAPT